MLLKLTDRGGGIGDVRVLVNDTAVSLAQGRDLGIAMAETGNPTSATQTLTMPIRLAQGANKITVIVFNAAGSVHSNPATRPRLPRTMVASTNRSSMPW